MDEELGTSTITASHIRPVQSTKQVANQLLLSSSDHIALDGTTTASTPAKESRPQAPTNASNQSTLAARALYPQFYEGATSQSLAIRATLEAADHIEQAVDSFSTEDLGGVWAALTLAASCLSNAHRHSDFNEGFGALVTYCGQALSQPDYNAIDLDALLTMKKVLNALAHQPFIRLSATLTQIEVLERFGWDGSDANVDVFVENLLRYFNYTGIEVAEDASSTEVF